MLSIYINERLPCWEPSLVRKWKGIGVLTTASLFRALDLAGSLSSTKSLFDDDYHDLVWIQPTHSLANDNLAMFPAQLGIFML